MRRIISIILVTQFLSCKHATKENNREQIDKIVYVIYEGVNDDITQTIDKDTSEISITKISDSIYVYKWNSKIGNTWDIKDSIDFAKGLIYSTGYASDSSDNKSYILDKRIVTLGMQLPAQYPIYKILTIFSDNSTSDMLSFWCPEFGVLIERPVDFGRSCFVPNRRFYRTEYVTENKKSQEMRELCFCIFSNIYCSYDFYSISKQEYNNIVNQKH